MSPIDVVEAAYDLDGDDHAWLTRLARLIRPVIDDGHGLLAYKFDIARPPATWYDDAVLLGLGRDDLQAIIELQSQAPDLSALVHLGLDGLMSASELARKLNFDLEKPPIADYYAAAGVKDYVAFQTVEPGRRGVVFCAGQGATRTFDRRTRHMWARINAHVAAGRRLRDAIARRTAPEEAILKPNGAVEHVEGDGVTKSSREALRGAVVRVEKARGKQRRTDPEAATEAWTALVAGRWSLVDRFERDGRRYIVARRNEHPVSDPRALTPRERAIVHLAALGKSNKLIGYELGLAESTIGSHLSQAMRKLGVDSRVALISLLAQLERATPS